METKRIFLAGFLIILVWVFWQTFFFPQQAASGPQGPTEPFSPAANTKELPFGDLPLVASGNKEMLKDKVVVFTIQNNLFKTTLSNELLGTFLAYSLLGDNPQHRGSFVSTLSGSGKNTYTFNKEAPVEFLFGKEDGFQNCNPCLEGFSPTSVSVYINNTPLKLEESLDYAVLEKTVVRFVDNGSGTFHELTFLPDSYIVTAQES